MAGPDRDGEAGLLDLTSLTLSDLAQLDDSVVADAIRRLAENQCGGAEYPARFSDFNSSL